MPTKKSDRIYDDYATLTPVHAGIDIARLRQLVAEELELYRKRTPKSAGTAAGTPAPKRRRK